MTRIIACLIGICVCTFVQAQPTYLHPSTLGLHFILNDFQPDRFLNKSAAMDAGVSINYLKGLRPRLDYTINITGSFPSVLKKQPADDHRSLLLQTDAQLRLRAYKKETTIQPFLSAGPGFYLFRNTGGAYVSSGAGLAFHYKDVYLESNTQYRWVVTSGMSSHFFYSIGIAGVISRPAVKRKKVLLTMAVTHIIRDRDGDGIVDSLDACPTVPGFARYKGCPVPDRDRDGIIDEEDQCPDTPGFLRYKGCPIPDTDKDGVNDEEDSCVLVPGVREKHGCPPAPAKLEEIALAAENIYFKTNSTELLPQSFPALDTIAMILEQNPRVRVRIEGHTDNAGTTKWNQKLSEGRAVSVKNYLTEKGIDTQRFDTIGYGDRKPLATNKTSEGRAKNRRVVFVLLNILISH